MNKVYKPSKVTSRIIKDLISTWKFKIMSIKNDLNPQFIRKNRIHRKRYIRDREKMKWSVILKLLNQSNKAAIELVVLQ